MDEWINREQHTHAVEYYSAFKRKVLTHVFDSDWKASMLFNQMCRMEVD